MEQAAFTFKGAVQQRPWRRMR